MGKGGIFLRYILFSLGSTLSKRVYPFLCDKETVNCPSLQRLQSNVQQEDIILLRSEDANKKSVKKIIEKERSLVFFPDYEEPSGNNDHSIYLREYFSEYEIRKAIDRLSTSDYISSLLRNSLAGSSDIMEKTRRQIRKAIDSSIPVHIVGETGTGKTLAAKLIHSLSSNDKQIVMENCGCLATSIADSELFGHARGAFSGAVENREGLLSSADSSTLFLDEIQDLQLEIQTKLLRVLDSGEFRRLGSDKVMKTSFRLITASNKTLTELLEEKRLRKDFYYRISGIEIRMPSLEEHREDIPELLQTFSKQKGKELGLSDYSVFMHPFPGNVRELFREAELYMEGIRH